MGKDATKILHIISDLGGGGAEIMLYRLLSLSDTACYDHTVVSLTSIVNDSADVRKLGIPVEFMGMKRGVPDPRGIVRLSRLIQREKPDIISTWMYHSNLIGSLAALMARTHAPVLWGIHHVKSAPGKDKFTTKITIGACARVSRSVYAPARIICCANATFDEHLKQGYPQEKMQVIYNGIDTEVFRPDKTARRELRKELGISGETIVVGYIARFDPVKDHRNFVAAAAILAKGHSNVCFLLCGGDVDSDNAELAGWIEDAGISDRCILLGRREDVPRVMAALDIFVSASYSEAFPLVIGEAMACCLPCVVTDVGDSALITGDTGMVTPRRNPQELAAACEQIIATGGEQRELLGKAARRRIETHFRLSVIVKEYEKLYIDTLGDHLV